MKQVSLDNRSGLVTVRTVPLPTTQPGRLIVRNHYSVVSAGTERHMIEFARKSILGKARSRPDLAGAVIRKIRTDGLPAAYSSTAARLSNWEPLGYSCSGTVVGVADDVNEFKNGDRVACVGSGVANHAEEVLAPKMLVASVPADVDLKAAAFGALGSTALHGIHRGGVQPGFRVAVIGLGLLGSLTAQILSAYGCQVLGIDVDSTKLELAKSLNLDGLASAEPDIAIPAAMDLSRHLGVDAVIITAATSSDGPVALAGKICKEGGTVCVVGDVGMNIDRSLYYDRELSLKVARSYGHGRYDPSYELDGRDYPFAHVRWTVQRNLAEFLRLVGDGRVNVGPLIGRQEQIDRAEEVYEQLLSGELKTTVLFKYTAEEPLRPRIEHRSTIRSRKADVSLGLIGAGDHARRTLLPILRKISWVELRGVATKSPLVAAQTAEKNGFMYSTTDYRQILEDDLVDLVVVATPHNLHSAITVEALGFGKDVFVEKPMSLDFQGLEAVANAAGDTDRRLMVGFNRRFAPFSARAKDHMQQRGPQLVNITVNAEQLPQNHWLLDPIVGGGRILGEVCHFVDLLCYLVSSVPKRVSAEGGSKTIPAGDLLSVAIEFENGSKGVVQYHGSGPQSLPKEHVQAIGRDGAAIIQNFRSLALYEGNRKKTIRTFKQDKGHSDMLLALLRGIRDGGPSPISSANLFHSTAATLNIPEALRSRQAVALSQNWSMRG